MTNSEVITQVNDLCDNQVDDSYKYRWLENLDATVDKEIHSAFRADFPEFIPGSADNDRVLLVPAPYDELYAPYLEMMIHSVTNEVVKYNNALLRFQSAYKAYGDFVCRTHTAPKMAWRLY